MSIPIIGTAVVTNPHWVHRLIMSVDYPVDNFLIINNNGKGEIDEELDNLTKITHNHISKIKVCHMPSNIGCSGAWNLIIKCYMMSPYWIIVNDDVAFSHGFLEEMVQAAESDEEVGIVHGYPGQFNLGSWDLFLIKEHVIRQYGLFDENLYPAYCEDIDYLMRFINRGMKRILKLNAHYYHGYGDNADYNTHGSQTSKSSQEIANSLKKSHSINFEYLDKKWGENWRECGPYDLPFNGEKSHISTTTYDIDFVRKKNTGF